MRPPHQWRCGNCAPPPGSQLTLMNLVKTFFEVVALLFCWRVQSMKYNQQLTFCSQSVGSTDLGSSVDRPQSACLKLTCAYMCFLWFKQCLLTLHAHPFCQGLQRGGQWRAWKLRQRIPWAQACSAALWRECILWVSQLPETSLFGTFFANLGFEHILDICSVLLK